MGENSSTWGLERKWHFFKLPRLLILFLGGVVCEIETLDTSNSSRSTCNMERESFSNSAVKIAKSDITYKVLQRAQILNNCYGNERILPVNPVVLSLTSSCKNYPNLLDFHESFSLHQHLNHCCPKYLQPE